MNLSRAQRVYLAITALLLLTLACRAAKSLIFHDTTTPSPTNIIEAEASCPLVIAKIMEEATTLNKNDADENTNEDIHLITYTFLGERLHNYSFGNVPENLRDEQKDRPTHVAIWNYFVDIIPPEQRNMLSEFSIFTDGKDNYLAGVAQTSTDPERWVLQVDILDSASYYNLTYTLIHEQGHLLTLTANQAPPNLAVYNNPDDQDIYDREASTCPQYFTGEGCSNFDSYINEFFNRFWTDFYEEWQAIDLEDNEDIYYSKLDDFYKAYKDQFVTDYAPTDPTEDIAESWTFFVLSPKPELNSIANEKILFFYEYPELVQLRQEILTRVCNSFPQ